VAVRRDLLTVGPCDLDPARHRALRAAFWGGPPGAPSGLPGADADDELARALAGAGPCVIWASGAWSDLTFLWSLVHALARLGAERPLLARPAAEDRAVSMGGVPAARVLRAFTDVAPLDEQVAGSCVTFWQAYVDPSPLGFDLLRREGAKVVRGLEQTLAGHGAWFPWRGDDDRLRLADADAAVLSWVEAGRLDAAGEVLGWIGDGGLHRRARAWQEHGVLAGTPGHPAPTEAARRLRAEGAGPVTAFAPLWVGGCRVNDPGEPWVRSGRPGAWRLELA
jgi:hypothetical protein